MILQRSTRTPLLRGLHTGDVGRRLAFLQLQGFGNVLNRPNGVQRLSSLRVKFCAANFLDPLDAPIVIQQSMDNVVGLLGNQRVGVGLVYTFSILRVDSMQKGCKIL